ncbi:MAG: rod shape-determining protein MreC [Pseudomonadota bacterium]
MQVIGREQRVGLGRKANSKAILLLLILVSALLLLSSLYAAEASVFKRARQSVVDASAPLLEMLAEPISMVQDMVGSVSDYFSVLEQNKALREENAELRQWMEEALQLRRTVAAFERLDGYRAPPDARPINAFVIGEPSDVYTQSMLLNAGALDQVAVGNAVVDDFGLVGRVVETGRRSARVLLLTDAQSRVPVYVEAAELEGILIGRPGGRPVISYTRGKPADALKPGQRVVTSGAGGVLPPGLPVGVVETIAETEASVDLHVNYVRTRLVRVINYDLAGLELDDSPPGDFYDVRDEKPNGASDGPAADDASASEGAEPDSDALTTISARPDNAVPGAASAAVVQASSNDAASIDASGIDTSVGAIAAEGAGN